MTNQTNSQSKCSVMTHKPRVRSNISKGNQEAVGNQSLPASLPHLLCPVTLSPTLPGALVVSQIYWSPSSLQTNLLHPIPPWDQAYHEAQQGKGFPGMHPFFSCSKQGQPSFFQNPLRWGWEPRQRNGNAIPSHTPFNSGIQNRAVADGKAWARDAKWTGRGFFEVTILHAAGLLCSSHCQTHRRIAQRYSLGTGTGTQAALTQY